MQASIRLGRVAGIPIGLHYSWLLIAALITISLVSHFTITDPSWTMPLVWTTAFVTALLFFVTLLAHELSHALVARSHGLPVRSITLFALGGLTSMERNASSAKTEFWMAIAGPATSVVIGLACMLSARAMGWDLQSGSSGAVAAVLGWLGSINILLGVFNLIPGYPLDGGRVLRAILWGVWRDADRATRNAARVGQVVAGIFIVLGVLRFLAGAGIGGLWIAFIGWFLLDAARTSETEVIVTKSLRGVRTADIMARDCEQVSAATTIETFVDQLMRTGRRCVMVADDRGEIVGLLTPHELRQVDRRRWPDVRVGEVMRPLHTLSTVRPGTPVSEALATMSREDVNQLPVMEDGHLVGIVTRGNVLRLVQTRAELDQ